MDLFANRANMPQILAAFEASSESLQIRGRLTLLCLAC